MGYILFGVIVLALFAAFMIARDTSHKEARRQCIRVWEALERASLHNCSEGDRDALNKFRELHATAQRLSMKALEDFGINNFGVMAYTAYEAFKKSFKDDHMLAQEAETFYREFVDCEGTDEHGKEPHLIYDLRLIKHPSGALEWRD